MTTSPVCPRCHGEVSPPGLMSSAWRCHLHGDVLPFSLTPPSRRTLEHLAQASGVPLWLPEVMPRGWVVSGSGQVSDHERVCATVVALSGPSPVGGAGDLVVVAEEPGVGLGARYAGLPHSDPGGVDTGRLGVGLHVDGHAAKVWPVEGAAAGRTALVGEAAGLWLWLIFWPDDADVLLLDDLRLVDARTHALPVVDFGALTPRLSAA